jgi:hypothetical protein
MENLIINTKAYFENFLKIRTKDGRLVPFVMNKPQRYIYDVIKDLKSHGKKVRLLILKSRQVGGSTFSVALGSQKAMTKKNYQFAIIAHNAESTSNLFEMSKRFYDNLNYLQPETKANNGYELVFNNDKGTGLDSKILCKTAGSTGGTRSFSLNFVLMSEIDHWAGDIEAQYNAIMASVSNDDDSYVIVESTPKGYNLLKKLWDNDKNSFTKIFIPWYMLEEYAYPVPEGFKIDSDVSHYGVESELKALYNLSDEQIQFRRETIDDVCSGNLDLFHQEYPSNPDECFLHSGISVFHKEDIAIQLTKAKNIEPFSVGKFEYKIVRYKDSDELTDIKWVPDKNGFITIHTAPEVLKKPLIDNSEIDKSTAYYYVGHPAYVIGADTAGSGEDYYAAKVINTYNDKSVATIHVQKIDEDLFAHQLYCLGKYYYNALIGVEINYSFGVCNVLNDLHYPSIYRRERFDSVDGQISDEVGFRTDRKSKPLMINNLITTFRKSYDKELDPKTLNELLTFSLEDNGTYKAARGFHDDLVMSLAIAHMIKHQAVKNVEWRYCDELINNPSMFKALGLKEKVKGVKIVW